MDRSIALAFWRDQHAQDLYRSHVRRCDRREHCSGAGPRQRLLEGERKKQAECYYDQADSLAEEILETVADKCRKLEQKPQAQAFCTAYGMAALLEQAKKWAGKP